MTPVGYALAVCDLQPRGRGCGRRAQGDLRPSARCPRPCRSRRMRRRGTAPCRPRCGKSTPFTERPCQPRDCGAIETLPRWGLRPNSPAPGRGDPDGSGAVGAESRADQPCSDRRSAAAAGAARRTLGVPGVARRAVCGGLGERPGCHSGNVCLADDQGAGLAEPSHHLGVGSRRPAGRVGAVRRELAGDVDVVLDARDRHTEQGPSRARPAAGVRLAGFEQHALSQDDTEAVEPRRPAARSARGTTRPAPVRTPRRRRSARPGRAMPAYASSLASIVGNRLKVPAVRRRGA